MAISPVTEREERIDEFCHGVEKGHFRLEKDKFIYEDENGEYVDVTDAVRMAVIQRAAFRRDK
jgi:hypothetical protein